jgi:hypothetical protein
MCGMAWSGNPVANRHDDAMGLELPVALRLKRRADAAFAMT